ncbi:hypothetical protein PQX77_007180 [Marasmius sp. AFHP31]|nr:hypothetical protein PQX77_007180 [Marasmius sp. AFHP31]
MAVDDTHHLFFEQVSWLLILPRLHQTRTVDIATEDTPVLSSLPPLSLPLPRFDANKGFTCLRPETAMALVELPSADFKAFCAPVSTTVSKKGKQ